MTITESAINRRLDALELLKIQPSIEFTELLAASDNNRIFEATGQSNISLSPSCRRSRSARKAGSALLRRAPNMLIGGLQSNSEEKIESCAFSGGFDGGSEISLFGSWSPQDEERKSAIFAALRAAKERARRYGAGANSALPLGGRVWVVQATGASSKNQFNRFPYRLISGGVTLLISDNLNKGFPSVRLVYGYEALVGRRFLDVHSEVIRVLKSAGFVVENEVVSRIDLQVTLDLPFELVADSFAEGRIVSRLRKWTRFDRQGAAGLNMGTLTGGHDLQICIYDKFRECIDKRNDDKLEDLYNLCDVVSTTFLRVEFRLRRSALRSMGFSSLKSIYNRLPDLIQFLTADWFRILKDQKVRGRENKQEIAPFWKRVQHCFQTVFSGGQKPKEVIKMRSKKRLSKKALVRQGLGCLVKALACATYQDEKPLTYEEFICTFKTLFDTKSEKFYKDYLDQYGDLRFMREKMYIPDERALEIPADVAFQDSTLEELSAIPLTENELAIPWDED